MKIFKAAITFLFGMSVLWPAPATAEIEYEVYNRIEMRPSAPTGLRIVSSSGTVVKPVLPYQDLLDKMEAYDFRVREKAATDLYNERDKFSYDMDLLAKYLTDDSETVTQYITSTLLDGVIQRPYKRRGLKGHLEAIMAVYKRVDDPYSKANCVALLSLGSDNFAEIEDVIETALNSGNPYEIDNASRAIQNYAPQSIELYKKLAGLLPVLKGPPQTSAANAMVNIANSYRNSREVFYADRLANGATALGQYEAYQEQSLYIRDVAEMIHRNYTEQEAQGTSSPTTAEYSIVSLPDIDLSENKALTINNKSYEVYRFDPENAVIQFLGDDPPFQQGLNFLDCLNLHYTIWFEDGILQKFDRPYKNIYAVLVAIDRYKSNSAGSKYDDLGNMVENAERLKEQLTVMGFPPENIIALYNKHATSENIDDALQRFWYGGECADADLLVFYYGGHGDYVEGSATDPSQSHKIGFLVTSDCDARRPTATSMLMRDLTGRHFENIVSRHVLMLIDSCSAGLALPRFQGPDLDPEKLAQFKKIVAVRSGLKKPARNIIVAGTGAQKALWENGGIFTQALVDGLKGPADLNRDGVVEFDELSLHLKNKVRARAAITGVEQEPRPWKAEIYGDGGVVFLVPEDYRRPGG